MKRFIIMVVAMLLVAIGLGASVSTATATEGGNQPCVPSGPTTETIHHDAVTHTVHHEAVPATPDLWWNWSPNKDQGPFDGPPDFPSDIRGTWQGPHENGGPDQDTFGTFNSSNGESGLASWFHRDHGTPGQDAYDEVVVDQEAYDEIVHHRAVYCQTPAPVLIDSVDLCGTDNDVPASLEPAESEFWTAVDTGSSFVVTANAGYYFSQIGDANGDLDDLVTVVTLEYTPLTDEACPTPPGPNPNPNPEPNPQPNPQPNPPQNLPNPPQTPAQVQPPASPAVPTVIDAGL